MEKKAVVVKSGKELGYISWFLHMSSLFIGLGVLGIIVAGWISNSLEYVNNSDMPAGLIIITASVFIVLVCHHLSIKKLCCFHSLCYF